MGDVVDGFRAMKEFQRDERADKRDTNSQDIEALRSEGFRVRKITNYQYRVNEALDLYPTRGKWHDLKTGERGQAEDMAAFVREHFKAKGGDDES